MWYFLFSIQTSLMQTYFTKILGWKTAFSYLFFVFQSLRVFAFLFSKIVLVAVQDSAASHVGVALDSLRRVGAIDPILVEFRGSYALIGTPDANKPPWVTQDQHPRYKGPSEISIRIPLSGEKKKKSYSRATFDFKLDLHFVAAEYLPRMSVWWNSKSSNFQDNWV